MKYFKAIRSGTARSKHGAEKDRGHIVHLVTNDNYPSWEKAICGIQPKGNGWHFYTEGKEVTCDRCLKKSVNPTHARLKIMETIQYPTETKAIKDHRCNYCNQPIVKGSTYIKSVYKYDDIYSWKSHPNCTEIANKLKMFEDCDEGLTADDFREIISNEYHVITEINPAFAKPPIPFVERLELVFKHHGLTS